MSPSHSHTAHCSASVKSHRNKSPRITSLTYTLSPFISHLSPRTVAHCVQQVLAPTTGFKLIPDQAELARFERRETDARNSSLVCLTEVEPSARVSWASAFCASRTECARQLGSNSRDASAGFGNHIKWWLRWRLHIARDSVGLDGDPKMAVPNMAVSNMAVPNMAVPIMAAPNTAAPHMTAPDMAAS